MHEEPRGIQPYDLPAGQQSIFPTYIPLRGLPHQGPETHAERMARTDREIEQAKREREAERKFAEAVADWAEVKGRAAGNDVAQVVLDIHKPMGWGDDVVCQGCYSLDAYGDPHDTWACDTFIAVRDYA